MATPTLLSTQELLFGSTRLTGTLKSISDAHDNAEQDATVFGSGRTKIFEPGLKGYGLSASGLWSATEDLALDGSIVARNVPVSFLMTTGVAGTPAYSVKAMLAALNRGPAPVGTLFPYDIKLAAMDRVIRGTVLHNASATGDVTGAAFQLGAVGASQFLYGVLHVFSGTGAFIVKIQSDNASNFATPTDRVTFATVATGTPAAYEWATPVAGAITDDYWRIVATNPNTRDFAVIAAIQ